MNAKAILNAPEVSAHLHYRNRTYFRIELLSRLADSDSIGKPSSAGCKGKVSGRAVVSDSIPGSVDRIDLREQVIKVLGASLDHRCVVGNIFEVINHCPRSTAKENRATYVLRDTGIVNENFVQLIFNIGPQEKKFAKGTIKPLALFMKAA